LTLVGVLLAPGNPEAQRARHCEHLSEDFGSRRDWTVGKMARGDVRIAVTLACEECKRHNYQTNKSKRNNPDRIEMKKYCRWCGGQRSHKETR
jgi:large subunit ribosomal protein L33